MRSRLRPYEWRVRIQPFARTESASTGPDFPVRQIAPGFGDLNQHGPDSIRFYTKTKTVTSRWPSGVKVRCGVLDPDHELAWQTAVRIQE
jgi:hypothetical protein